jgi:hypothetical protein
MITAPTTSIVRFTAPILPPCQRHASDRSPKTALTPSIRAIAGELAQMCLAFPPGVFDMRAGESARNVAKRQRMEAERLQRSAELWERGADGEAAVARALEALPDGWIVLHDLPWPGRQRANLDHVVVGPTGVFVVDAKNWSGRIEVRDGVLSQNGRQRESAVSSVTAAAISVQGIVAPYPCAVFSASCVTSRWQPRPGTSRCAPAPLWSPR